MTLTDFEAAYGRARELGHQWVQFKVTKKSEPRNWDRVQVMPMLYGTCRGHIGDRQYLVDVKRDDLEAWLVKVQATQHKSDSASDKHGTGESK